MTTRVTVREGERELQIETAWVGPSQAKGPLLVFLHEGLGSVAMWRDFPRRLCEAARVRGLVYSREGYGRSTPRPARHHWAPDFMHQQALQALPALLQALEVAGPYVLFGHSDGGSIALVHAAAFPARVAGVVALAPHIMVEPVSVESIARTREAYFRTDLRERLARYHDDVDSAFWGWNDAWLNPAFRDWSIEALLPAIGCPVLAIQGEDDEYGTMAQIDGIAARVPQAQLLKLAQCGHSPQRDQPAAVIETTCRFLAALR